MGAETFHIPNPKQLKAEKVASASDNNFLKN